MAQTAKETAKAPADRTRAPATKSATTRPAVAQHMAAVDRAAQMSDDVLKSVEAGQRAAIEAVRTFVDTVDEALPALGGHPSRREAIIDAALEMADKLVTTQYEFLRRVVRGADRSLSKPTAPKR